jgi:hypothetical protein
MSMRSVVKETGHIIDRGVTRVQTRCRHMSWIAATVAVSLAGAAGLLWGKSWLFSGPLERAASAYSHGNYAEAEVLARKHAKQAPGDEDALRLAARAAARLDRDQAAVAIYSRLELRRMMAEDYFLLGRALSRIGGQDDSALKALEKSWEIDHTRPETLDELAPVYYRKDRPAAAEETASRLSKFPGWEAKALLMLGSFRAERRDPAGAALALGRGFQLDPSGKSLAPRPAAPMQMLLARSLLQTGKPAEARAYLLSLPPSGDDPEAAWLLSRCFLQEHAWTQAAQALQKAVSYRQLRPIDPEPAPFLGAVRCASCHRTEYKSVLASRHATTFSHAREPRAFPLPGRPLADPGNPSVAHAFERREDGLSIESRQHDQVFRALARYAFGSPDNYVTLVGPDEQGQPRMLRISYFDSPKGAGWDITSGLEPRPARLEDYSGNKLDADDGTPRCLGCHTTNFRAVEDQVGPESADHSIGCEACHGPGGNHVLAVESRFPDTAIVNPKEETSDAVNQMCHRCHGVAHVEAFSGPDDDPAWIRFQSTTMFRSRCYSQSEGKLNCVTCHDPHANAATNSAQYEARCLDCHGAASDDQKSCPVSASHGCIDCHMPRIWVPSTHSFKSDHNIRVHDRGAARKAK